MPEQGHAPDIGRGPTSTPQAPAPPPHTHGVPNPQAWAKAVSAVSQASSRYGTALSHARLVQLEPPLAHLAFAPQAGFHQKSVFGSGRDTIEKVLSAFFQTPIQLVEDNRPQAYGLATPSLAEQHTTHRESQTRKLETKVHAHPSIQSALAILGGEIEAVRRLPPSAPAPSSPLTSFPNHGNDDDD